MRTLTIALILSAVVGCTEPDGLNLDLSVDRTTVAFNESVALSLRLVNTSWRPVTVVSSDSYGICFHAFEVYTTDQRQVNVLTGFCAAALQSFLAPRPVELAPGGSITITDQWKPADSSIDGQPIPPGLYRLIGRAIGNGDAVYSGDIGITVDQ